MKRAHILHNPTAGGQDLSKNEIIRLIESQGYECGYSSTKEMRWKKLDKDTDFLVVAGGDGTVRKVALELLKKERFKKHVPILLLPLGTANNISKTLDIAAEPDAVIAMLENKQVKRYDVGIVEGLKKEDLFLESFGYGVFPELINRMKEIPEREDATPEENLKRATEELHKIVEKYRPKTLEFKIDGVPYSGKFIMAEVMNGASIGPNLVLSANTDPGDGEFDVVLIPESQREEFASYISYKISGVEKTFTPQIIKGKDITLSTPGGLLHIDDELIKTKKPKKIRIRPEWGMLEFFVQ